MNQVDLSSYSGGCLCGAVRYRAVGRAAHRCFCHCDSCRRATGASAVPWATFERARFVVTQGELREFRSSPPVVRGFCGTCGTTLTYQHRARPDEIDVALATLDTPEALAPQAHIWVEDKPSWVAIGDGLPQYDKVRFDAQTTPSRVVRPGYSAVSVRLVVDDVEGLARFIKQVLGAQGEYTPGRPAELRIGDSTLMVGLAGPRPPTPGFVYVYVGDVDASHERAVALGARSLEAPADLPYGDRRCMVEDAWGNVWQIASYAPHAA